jgi:hypothetical protein
MILWMVVPSDITAEADIDMRNPLEDYVWKNRPVVLFAPSEQHAQFKKQQAMLSRNYDGLAERDIVVIPALEDDWTDVKRFFGQKQNIKDDEFAVLLIGKDGEVKLSSRNPVSIDRLFNTIDSMPMRQREMRSQ